MHPRAILARNLKRLRNIRSMSQEDLAHEAKMDRTYLSDLEREKYAATVDMLLALATALGVKPNDLIDEEYEPARPAR